MALSDSTAVVVLIIISVFGFFCLSANAGYLRGIGICEYVGPWSIWSDCLGTSKPTADVPDTKPMTDEIKALGKGRMAMQRMKEMKLDESRKRMECMENFTCHKIKRSSRGPANCDNGVADGYQCRNVHLKYLVDFHDLGYGDDLFPGEERSGNDIWAWHDEVGNGNYVIMGTSGGCSFVRITNPESPEVLGFLPSHTDASLWRDMKVVKDHVYIVSEASHHGMQVFDLTQLRDLEADSTRRFAETTHYSKIGSSHNIVGFDDADLVLIVGATQIQYSSNNCRGGLHIVDVANPNNPKFAGCYGSDGYIHDAQCVVYPATGPDATYRDKHICFTYAEDSFTVVDITNPAQGSRISRVYYTGCFYSHQGWASDDMRLVLLDDELDERESLQKNTQTYVFDITDLDAPKVTQRYTSTQTSIDHNQYITDNKYSHQSNYEAGYRLIEIDTTNHQVIDEVASFDLYPSSTGIAFEGSWSNYPFFGNGIIPVSSINDGLFILEVDWAAIENEKLNGAAYGERQRHRAISGDACSCPHSVEVEACSPL